MKYVTLFTLFFYSCFLYAQIPPPAPEIKNPEILPPSPDVAAFMKGGQLSLNMHTGAANASIPVYELKMKEFSFPISMNYSSNGYKPGENSSRTGLGWSLSATGTITRVIRGKPDDYCTTPTPRTIPQITDYSAASLNYINDLENEASYHDAQPDEYSYSVNGLSGKFIIDRSGNVLQLPYNNLKIWVVVGLEGLEEVNIKDDRGIRYTFGFGSVIEKTLEHNLVNNMLNKQQIKTAWMLTKITLPNGDWLNFSYIDVTNRAETGTITTIQKRIYNSQVCDPTPPCTISQGWPLGPPSYCPVGTISTSKTQFVKYFSKAISNILTSTGLSVSFMYEDRADTGGDTWLKQIFVLSSALPVKSMEFEYAYAYNTQPQNELTAKFFLKNVLIKDPSNGSASPQTFELKYNDNGLPFELPAGGPDHLGFATNGVSSTPMSALTPDEELFVTNIVSKHPNGEYSKIGMLKRITYPTGGYDEFLYEPNMKTWWDNVENVNVISARVMGAGASSNYPVYTTNFTVSKPQTAEFWLNTSWLGSPPVPDGDPAPKTGTAKLLDLTTNNLVAMRTAYGYPGGAHYVVDGPQTVSLSPGIQYQLWMEVRYSTEGQARADVVYDAGSGTEWKKLNEELCGVRVRKINSFDPVSKKTASKFYQYFDITDSLKTVANKLYYPKYISEGQSAMWCECAMTYSVICNSKIYSTNSSASMFQNQAGGVTYSSVIESDDSLFANGGIQHNFYTQGALAAGVVLGTEIPDRPAELYDFRNGRDTQTLYFNKDLAIVKKTKSFYSYDSRISQYQDLNYIIRKRYEPNPMIYPVTDHSFLQLDVMEYRIESKWDHLDSTVTWDYDLTSNKELKTKTEFQYATTAIVQPSAQITKGSDGIDLRTEMKYPTDFPSQPVAITMVTNNVVTPVIEQKSFKGSKLLFQTNTDYKDWFNNATIIAPEIIRRQKNGGTMENLLRFHQYDTKGNTLEFSKENDVRVSYIWDYDGTLPVAEVTNASWGQGIAYTSFESTGNGGWIFSGNPQTEGTEPGGNKSYSLSTGNITYTSGLISGKKYIVSYWAKGGAVSVNGGTGTVMLTKNNWTLYKYVVTYYASGGITVSGTGYIDELRLFPEGSFMKSMTYIPEVGITTAADYNNLFQRYEYDVFHRLLRIRDMDRNILKQHEYNYGNDITGCPNNTADWQVTGNLRCAKNNAVNNNNTGLKEREEIDVNNCSSTYGEKRWISIGTSAECPITPNCSGPDKRAINGVCVTGCKMLVSSRYIGNLVWECTYHYLWDLDGFIGPDFTETNTYNCIPGTCN